MAVPSYSTPGRGLPTQAPPVTPLGGSSYNPTGRPSQLQSLYDAVGYFGGPNRDESNPYRGVELDTNPHLAQAVLAGQGRFGERGGLLDRLDAQAQGQGPSLVAEQLRQAQMQNVAAQQSLAAGNRRTPGLAARMASLNAGQVGAQLAGQAAQGRIQEQFNAQKALAELQMFNAQQSNLNNYGRANLGTQLAMARENARTQRYGAVANQPSAFERGANVLGSIAGGFASLA